jgi:hypothetical protein
MSQRRFGMALVAAPGQQLAGKVAWISAEKMVVAVLAGDRVIVTGRLEGNRLVATAVQRVEP